MVVAFTGKRIERCPTGTTAGFILSANLVDLHLLSATAGAHSYCG
jgi:hypothetical protein